MDNTCPKCGGTVSGGVCARCGEKVGTPRETYVTMKSTGQVNAERSAARRTNTPVGTRSGGKRKDGSTGLPGAGALLLIMLLLTIAAVCVYFAIMGTTTDELAHSLGFSCGVVSGSDGTDADPLPDDGGEAVGGTTAPTTAPTTTADTTPTTAPDPDEVTELPGGSPYNGTDAQYYDPAKTYKAGDRFLLGRYEQDNDAANGTEDIEWRVIRINKDGRILAISVYGLESRCYNDTFIAVTWETCELRGWLNDVFFLQVFTEEERGYIAQSEISNPDNPNHRTDGGAKTLDNIFCITYKDYCELFADNADRIMYPTEYALANGAHHSTKTGSGNYWLRTPGSDQKHVTYGALNGSRNTQSGTEVDHISNTDGEYICVRPAIYLSR